MIKDALQYLIGLGNTRIEQVNGRNYSTQPVHAIKTPIPGSIVVHSLSGLVDYLKSKFDDDAGMMIHVVSPTRVDCFGSLNIDANRSEYIGAKALLPSFSFDRFYDTEEFNIKMQSCFVNGTDRDTVLKVVGNIKEEAVKSVGDDGVSQAVTAKTGVATVGNVKVPNPVVLKPYRTFIEVEQPASDFVFRMQNGPKCALFEADGGAWQLEAMNNIKKYMQDELKDDSRIHIIA